jgi:hypothetical protein
MARTPVSIVEAAGPASHLAAVPDIAQVIARVLADPATLDGLPRPVLVELQRQLRHVDADVAAALTRTATPGQGAPEITDVLDVTEAAKRLNTSTDSLYRRRKALRLGYLDPLDKHLKFTAHEIAEYIRRRQGRG